VEAYFPESGWVRFDPSPRAASVASTQRWMLRIRERWEYVNFQWNRLVIEYDLYSQIRVVQDIQTNTNRMNAWMGTWADRHLMGFRRPGPDRRGRPPQARTSTLFRFGSFTVFAGLIAWVSTIWRRRSGHDPAIAFYRRYLARMARRGYPKASSETGWEYVERLRTQLDAAPLVEITQRYYAMRFARPGIR
jgi:hypothetical protein